MGEEEEEGEEGEGEEGGGGTRGQDEKGGSGKLARRNEKPMQMPSSSGTALGEPHETLGDVPRRSEVIARACKGGCGANQPIS